MNEIEHWDNQWKKRIISDARVKMNIPKFWKIRRELLKRPSFGRAEKLEIGCASGIHARIMAQDNPWWKERWTGIDLSEIAVNYAKKIGMNAIVADISTFKTDKRFNVFLLLDTLEHIKDRDAAAATIKSLGAKSYIIFGNIPLYTGKLAHESGCEWPVSPADVVDFLKKAGCTKSMWYYMYGMSACPYMLFESSTLGYVTHDVGAADMNDQYCEFPKESGNE